MAAPMPPAAPPPGSAANPGGHPGRSFSSTPAKRASAASSSSTSSLLAPFWGPNTLDAALDEADLVITGEGSFDHQSLRGKVVAGVAAACLDRGVPCLVVAGRVDVGRREAAAIGVTETHSLVDHLGSVDAAMAEAAHGIEEISSRLAAQWSRRVIS